MAADCHTGTYSELVLSALRRFPEREAFRHGGRSLSYRQAEATLSRWVGVLATLGVGPGTGVGLLAPNRPEVWLGQVAPGFLGSRYTPLHPLGSLDDHLAVCEEAELRVLLVDPAFAERAAALAERCNAVSHVLTFGPADVGRDLLALADETAPVDLRTCTTRPDSTAWLLYTGGTTGSPKGVELSERAVAHMATTVSIGWDLPRERRYLAVAPISHAAGMLVTPTLLTGGTVITQQGWDPGRWMAAVTAERATVSLLVPTMIYSLLDAPDLDTADLSTLETIMYGASPMAPARLEEGIERIGPVFCQLYGQTECAGVATSLWRHQHERGNTGRLGSCGQALPGVRVAVLDDDGGPVALGSPGEIAVQSAAVMSRYFKRPELTAATLVDGWLRTGDVAVEDDEGFITIVDRKKDMIVTGGFNVFPREVEDVILSDPSVGGVAVIGVPDPKWGEAVRAVVVPRPGATIDEQALIALVRQRKGPLYAPKAIDVVDGLPLTPVGKPDKKALRAPYWAGQARRVG